VWIFVGQQIGREIQVDHFRELGLRQRFLDRAQHAHARRPRHDANGVEQGGVERGQHHYRIGQLLARDVADELDAIHVRQIKVHQHHVHRAFLLAEREQCAATVRGIQHVAYANLLQQPHRHLALEVVVLDHQHRNLRELGSHAGPLSILGRSSRV